MAQTEIPGLKAMIDELADLAADAAAVQDGYHYHGPDNPRETWDGEDEVGWWKGPRDTVRLENWEEIRDGYRGDIETLLEPWVELPEPSDLQAQFNRLLHAAELLSTGTALDGVTLPTNNDLGDIDTVRQNLQDMDGQTIDAFLRFYMNILPGITNTQCQAACQIAAAVQAEAVIWKGARESVVDLVNAAIDAMQQLKDDAGTGDSQADLVVSGAAAIIFGTIAGGPVGTAFVVAGTVTQGYASVTATPQKVTGSTPGSIIGSLGEGLDALDTDIETEETTISDELYSLRQMIDTDRAGSYNLREGAKEQRGEAARRHRRGNGGPVGEDLTDATDHEDFVNEDGIIVDPALMKTTGRDIMPPLASVYGNAARKMAPLDSTHWTRDSRLGKGVIGHYFGMSAAAEGLLEALKETEFEVREAGEHLAIAADFIKRSDADVEADLRKHHRQVERDEQPPPPPPVRRPPGLGFPL